MGKLRHSHRRLWAQQRPGRGAKRRGERGEPIPLLTISRGDARREIDDGAEREENQGQLYEDVVR
jgi:hypothetical protein